MTLSEPIPFQQAIDQLAQKKILPTTLNSAELQAQTGAALRERAFFSSTNGNAQILQELKNAVAAIVQGDSNQATQRAQLKQLGSRLNYQAPENKEGSIVDWFSNKRLNLILETGAEMVRGFAQFAEGITEGALDAFPAQELIRVSARAVPREWIEIWDDAADDLGEGATSATDAESTGRMVALKNDPIWEAISDFDLPYPPFKFNSGMGVRDVSYEDAVDLGVMDEDKEIVPPLKRGLNTGLAASVADLDPAFAQVLADGLSNLVTFAEGVLTFKNSRDYGQAVLEALRS